MKPILIVLSIVGVLALPQAALAGKGASYASLKHAISTASPDSIIAEVERAEKLPCGSCIALIQPLIDDPDPRVRDVAAWWLAKRAVREQIRDEMFVRLRSGDTTAARNAAEVLGRFMHPDAIMGLEIAIHDAALGEEARAAAATAVGTIGHYGGKGVLEAALTSESKRVRAAAAAALRNVRGNTDAVVVVELLSDVDADVVRQAVLTIGALREVAAIQDLVTLITDPDQDTSIRKDAAWALGKIGDGSVREVLRSVAEDDHNMLVRGAARSAYHHLR